MSWIKNLGLIAFSTLIALVLIEVLLRVDGRYADVAGTRLEASNTIFSRVPNSVDHQPHPDIPREIRLVFDEYGNRNHSEVDFGQVAGSIGIFGDSYAENRRVEDAFTFTTALNQLAAEPVFVNFGTSGFGLEQSFQRYLNVDPAFDMRHVVYLFCYNDFRNLYEVQLFEPPYPEDAADLVNTSQRRGLDAQLRQGLGRLHTTYLVMTAWFQLKGRDVGDLAAAFSRRIGNRPPEAPRERLHDAYADSMTEDLLGDAPGEESLAFAERFAALLRLWAETVEANGQSFHVAVLPTEIGRAVFEALVPDRDGLNVHYLQPNDAFPAIGDRPWSFENDDHWNEFANLGAAASLAGYLAEQGAFEPARPVETLWALVPRIETLYQTASD